MYSRPVVVGGIEVVAVDAVYGSMQALNVFCILPYTATCLMCVMNFVAHID